MTDVTQIRNAVDQYHDVTSRGIGQLTDRLEKIEAGLDAKSRFDPEHKQDSADVLEHKQAFDGFLRGGETAQLRE